MRPIFPICANLRRHVARRAAPSIEYLRAVAPCADAKVGKQGAGGWSAGGEEDVVRFNVLCALDGGRL